MSYLGQNRQRVLKTLNSNESLILGSMDLSNAYTGPIELVHVAVDVVVENFAIGLEMATLEIHHESTCNSLKATSDIFYFNRIDKNLPSWRGIIRFDFNNISLNQRSEYWLKMNMINYTRSATPSYIGVYYDWPLNHSQNDNTNPLLRSFRFDPYIRSRTS
jgi:hypothetical protein